MFRIDAIGFAPGNLFTEGNPSLGEIATKVSAEWLNDAVQEELANLVEGAGLTLDKGNNGQVILAVLALLGLGGTQVKQSITNNESSPTDITGIVFDKTDFKAGKFDLDIFRKTSTQEVKETGVAFVSFNDVSALWDISLNSVFDDAGVTLSIDASGQVRYISDDLTGSSYVGNIRIANVIKFSN